ncbi:GNAT family N-acetyltransferase [Microbacterium aerolatum]|uniref:GNAT family N-acetyltransferase n=1 Tax=Microbacterium aerolatum TaxID=153731 RepID=UPI0020008B31|nr:GNAT family N-acetyltransferase [Microbacterium aerolatum]MCK3768274.1 GNAT family N-acetyltransferase [Microbacterium aerolatum]
MTLLAEELTITEMVIPASVDAPDAEDFLAMVDLANEICVVDAGTNDLHEQPEEMLPRWLDRTDSAYRGYIARRGGAVVGAAYLKTSNEAGSTTAESDIMVIPPHRASGVAQALLTRVEDEVRLLGRTLLQVWTLHQASTSDRMLMPATGHGRVPANELSDLFTDNGYTMEQVERTSTLALDGDLSLAERMLAEATAVAGDDYRVIAWTLPTPEHLREGYGHVISRMATDVPSGDLVFEEEKWDAARVVRHDQVIADAGQLLSVAAVEHVPSGRIVAFNELVIGPDRSGVTHQYGTLVVKEHRGKRLGTIVKCTNLLRWQEIAPQSPKICTFNAEENRPMLNINEAIGFVPASYAAGWQKKLA